MGPNRASRDPSPVTAPSLHRMSMDQGLEATIEELSPKLPSVRFGSEFLFNPEALDGYPTVRDYYVEYLRWLDIPPKALPTSRFHIHGDRPHPADIEFRTPSKGRTPSRPPSSSACGCSGRSTRSRWRSRTR